MLLIIAMPVVFPVPPVPMIAPIMGALIPHVITPIVGLEHRSSMGAGESACLLLYDDTVKCLVHPDDASGGTYARHGARAHGSLYVVVLSRQEHSVSDVRGGHLDMT